MRLIAHRSGPTVYPEQTVSSALLSFADGAELVEVDVRFSRDGVPLISHDRELQRVFGTDQCTNEITAAEFCALRHINAPEFHGHTLKDYIDSGVFPMLLHIKEGGEHLPALLDFLRKSGCLDKVIVGVSATEDIAFLKQYDNNIKVLAFMRSHELYADSVKAGADFIRLWENWYTDSLFRKIKDLGKEVWIMTGGCDGYEVGYTSSEKLRFFKNIPVDGLLINNVNL